MAWEFINIYRKSVLGDDNWGTIYIKNQEGQWETLCYSYELTWNENVGGPLHGKSKNKVSQIAWGIYPLKPRSDGPKGWRLELQNTGHRENIQIHRAHSSMYIEGCILPVTFNNHSEPQLRKGDYQIQKQSVALMDRIKQRYEELKSGKDGEPTVSIGGNLPAFVPGLGKQHA